MLRCVFCRPQVFLLLPPAASSHRKAAASRLKAVFSTHSAAPSLYPAALLPHPAVLLHLQAAVFLSRFPLLRSLASLHLPQAASLHLQAVFHRIQVLFSFVSVLSSPRSAAFLPLKVLPPFPSAVYPPLPVWLSSSSALSLPAEALFPLLPASFLPLLAPAHSHPAPVFLLQVLSAVCQVPCGLPQAAALSHPAPAPGQPVPALLQPALLFLCKGVLSRFQLLFAPSRT